MASKKTNEAKPMRVSTEYGEVALDPKNGKYWRLNEVASRILTILEGGGSQEDAIQDLIRNYGIDADRASADVSSICEDFRQRGLL
ncbi:MAG: lasso peptide biosynthesis PqqD family chaperone [Brevibacterium aurantiacum]